MGGSCVFPMEDHDVKTYFEALELSIDDVFWHRKKKLTWESRTSGVSLENHVLFVTWSDVFWG